MHIHHEQNFINVAIASHLNFGIIFHLTCMNIHKKNSKVTSSAIRCCLNKLQQCTLGQNYWCADCPILWYSSLLSNRNNSALQNAATSESKFHFKNLYCRHIDCILHSAGTKLFSMNSANGALQLSIVTSAAIKHSRAGNVTVQYRNR